MTTPDRPPPSAKMLFAVAAYGAVSALVAWAIAGGSPLVFLAVMLAIGIGMRLLARHLVIRRGQRPPRGWWK